MAVMPYFLPFHALMGLLELPSSQLKLLSASPGSEPVPSDNMAPVGVLAIGGD